jgi:hypothetical protein
VQSLRDHTCGHTRQTVGLVAAVLGCVCLSPATARALDGRVDLWLVDQSGGAGLTAYETRTFDETYSIGQRLRLSRGLDLTTDLTARRQWLESDVDRVETRSHLETLIPTFGLTYASRRWRAGLNGQASRRDDFFSDGMTRRDEYGNVEFWVHQNLRWLLLEVRLRELATRRRSLSFPDRDVREDQQEFNAELNPARNQQLRYQFSRQGQTDRTTGHELNYLSHDVRWRSQIDFAERRGRLLVDANVGTFDQRTFDPGSGVVVLVPPLSASVALDGTPEIQDTLEPDPVPVAALIDNDRDTPTTINIGDNASVVRQFGGDYRNIGLDFGEPESFTEMILYVDRDVRFPELIEWLVYVSDDPEGRDWGQRLPPGSYAMVYERFENARQGWRLTFSQALTHRFVKVVDVKRGATEADLFVTELEVYRPAPDGQDSEFKSDLVRRRLDGELDYEVVRHLELSYATELQDRNFDGEGRDSESATHRLGLDWRPGGWWFAAHVQTYRVTNDGGFNTDSRGQQAAVGTDPARSFYGRLSWARLDDRSYINQDVTNSYAANATWRLAPLLTLDQTVSYGVRVGRDDLADSKSWVTVTDLRGMPWPNLDVALRRSDRWVSQAAGVGFTTYNDTELTTNWTPVRLVTLASEIEYEERDVSSWVVRNTLSWTPLPGGSAALRLYGFDYRDTRTDFAQRGGGWNLTLKARTSLRLDGGQEWTRLEQGDQSNSPTMWHARGTWTF